MRIAGPSRAVVSAGGTALSQTRLRADDEADSLLSGLALAAQLR
jgi:hypothetical protein